MLHPSPVCLSTGPADLLLSENQKTAKKLLLMTRTQKSVCLNSSFIILIESKCLLETKSYTNFNSLCCGYGVQFAELIFVKIGNVLPFCVSIDCKHVPTVQLNYKLHSMQLSLLLFLSSLLTLFL